MGQVARDFESAFAKYLGVKHVMAVSSGTAAMHLAHHALGFQGNDEVICPSLTFVATANAVRYTGATAVFADITSLDDLTIAPQDVESKIDKRTRAIVVVHYAGFPCDMDSILEIARNHNLFVVEDAAHAPGAMYSSKLKAESSPLSNGQRSTVNGATCKVGTIGDIGCFSFFGNKNMTTAEGGLVVTNRDDLAEKIKIARSHGMTSLTWDRYEGHNFTYDVVDSGFNYRIDELRSSLGLAQLDKLDANNKRRGVLRELYREMLSGIEGIEVPFSHFDGVASHHIFPILLSERIGRKDFMEYLREQGIQTSIHYPPIHLFSYYRNLVPPDTHLPITEDVGRREVTLPLFPTMTEEQLEYVVDTIKDFLSKSRWPKGGHSSPS
jgi:dTDP-4-amino-4,6-dideoxygalactose transaminase